ncbi:MAG: hypothetical protein GY755_24225, partial [Chloroflexi bacterium]|nr:hypothetical protein [Chloroflexota bacterium]
MSTIHNSVRDFWWNIKPIQLINHIQYLSSFIKMAQHTIGITLIVQQDNILKDYDIEYIIKRNFSNQNRVFSWEITNFIGFFVSNIRYLIIGYNLNNKLLFENNKWKQILYLKHFQMLLIKVANEKFNILIWFYIINKNNITFDCIFTTYFLKIFQAIINKLKIDYVYSRKIIQIINGVSHHKLDYLNNIK